MNAFLKRRHRAQAGFTFIEVLVAMLIFVTAVSVAVGIIRGAVRATRDSKEMSVAVWLAQGKMVELETKLETAGFEKGCDKLKEGKFDAPLERYRWKAECYEVDLHISETADKLQKAMGESDENSQESKNAAIQKLIFDTVNTYMGKALREFHVEVLWEQGKTTRSVALTSHFARYDLPIDIPNFGAATGGGT